MSSTSDVSEWKVVVVNDPVLYRGTAKNFKPYHPMVYRIVLWEKPYVTEWFKQQYRTSFQPSATIAYSRHIMFGMYAVPEREWVERNMPLIAFTHLYNSILLSEVIVRKFPDEFQWAQEIFDARCNQKNLITSSANYEMF